MMPANVAPVDQRKRDVLEVLRDWGFSDDPPLKQMAGEIARTLVHEHQAVYDTREFVLVSVHDVERMDRLTAIGNLHAGFVNVPAGTLDDVREVLGCIPTGYEPVDATRRLRALLPEGGDDGQ
jgi:hypothetical protein